MRSCKPRWGVTSGSRSSDYGVSWSLAEDLDCACTRTCSKTGEQGPQGLGFASEHLSRGLMRTWPEQELSIPTWSTRWVLKACSTVPEKCWGQWDLWRRVPHSFLSLLHISKRRTLPESRWYISQSCSSSPRCGRSTFCDPPPEGVGYATQWKKNEDNPNITIFQCLELVLFLLIPLEKEGLAAWALRLPSQPEDLISCSSHLISKPAYCLAFSDHTKGVWPRLFPHLIMFRLRERHTFPPATWTRTPEKL